MKTSYDKFPALKVPVDGECRAVAGWETIGAELRAKIATLGQEKTIVCIDLYHGVWEDEVLAAVKAAAHPDVVVETREAN